MNQITKPRSADTVQARAELRIAHDHLAEMQRQDGRIHAAARRADDLISSLHDQLARVGDAERRATRWRTERLKAGEDTAAPLPSAIRKKLEAGAHIEAELKAAKAAQMALGGEADEMKTTLAPPSKPLAALRLTSSGWRGPRSSSVSFRRSSGSGVNSALPSPAISTATSA